jgi:hypothetical protein
MSMIGFMVGTCIAFFVVIGDLAPPIIAYIVDVVPSENLRILTMLGNNFFASRCTVVYENPIVLRKLCSTPQYWVGTIVNR